MNYGVIASFAAAVTLCLAAPAAHAGDGPVFEWQEADWRMELSLMHGIDSGRRDREEDWSTSVAFDYEVPFHSEAFLLDRSTFGFRLRPLMYYYAEEPDDHIFGAGGGFAVRIFQHKDTKSGIFGEIAEEIVFHTPKFDGNSTSFNFMSEFGVGYQSPKSWFVTLRFQHLSNAGLGSNNAGVNGVGIAAGFRF